MNKVATCVSIAASILFTFGLALAGAGLAEPLGADPAAPAGGEPVELDLPQPIAGGVPVVLSLDDGAGEASIGDSGQFVWFNRFTPAPAEFPFMLTDVQVIFGSTNVPVGGAIDLVVYEDTDGDGDPGTGAVHLATFNDVVQVADDVTFSTYTLAPPVILNGPGDVLIGVVNRYGSEGNNDFPAEIDTSSSAVRSWAASYLAGDAPDPPTFPADEQWGTIDSFGFPGNWIVRGSGETIVPATPVIEIPTLTSVGLVLLAILLGAGALSFLWRRQRS